VPVRGEGDLEARLIEIQVESVVPEDLITKVVLDRVPHLKLSAALKTLIGQEILEADLVETDKLLREYTTEIVEVRDAFFH
jgi:hypothetical protein